MAHRTDGRFQGRELREGTDVKTLSTKPLGRARRGLSSTWVWDLLDVLYGIGIMGVVICLIILVFAGLLTYAPGLLALLFLLVTCCDD